MATKSRRKSTSVSDKLFTEPLRFSFFQAARLLQGLVKKWRPLAKNKVNTKSTDAVGHDGSPLDEPVKFSSFPSLKFASSEIVKISSAAKDNENNKAGSHSAEMQVSFMGLTGQSSVLPVHFTELLISRTRDKDFSLKGFYDLFNHRAVSFFYRSWEKYRLPFTYERAKLENKKNVDPITANIQSVIGISGDTLQKQLQINPEDMLFYAGFFASPNRSASSLSAALTDILDIPVTVNQFKGEWVSLLEEDRLRLPVFPLKGQNNCLGVDTVIGNEVFTVEGKFQLEMGPLNNKQFKSLQPGSPGQEALKRFTRLFVGDGFHFELKYDLEDDAISNWELKEEDNSYPGLGLNTWLLGEGEAPPTREIIVDVS